MLVKDLPVLIKILLGKEACKWYTRASYSTEARAEICRHADNSFLAGYQKIASFLLLRIPETLTIDDILLSWTNQVAQLKEHVEKMKIKMLSKVDNKLDGLKDQIKTSETSILTLLANSSLQMAMMDKIKEIANAIPKQLSDLFRAQQASAAAMTGLFEEMQCLRGELNQERERRDRDHELFSRERENWSLERDDYYRILRNSQKRQDRLERGKGKYHVQPQIFDVNFSPEKSNLSDQIGELTRQTPQSSHEPQSSSAAITPIQLLGVIGVPMHAAWGDLDVVLRQANCLDAVSQGQARWLITTQEFRGWFGGSHSSLLLADGCTTEQIQLVSPMSGFCATLVSSLIDDEESIVLFFFAGLHCRSDGADRDFNGPRGIIRSLIAQLLLNSRLPKPNLDFIYPEFLEDCNRQNLRALCHIFVHLIQQVPPGIQVFCIVDGISWYEQPLWLTELRFVAAMFEYLAKQIDPDWSGVLKVLMTSPGKSMEIVKRTMEQDSVWRHASLAAGYVHPGTFATS